MKYSYALQRVIKKYKIYLDDIDECINYLIDHKIEVPISYIELKEYYKVWIVNHEIDLEKWKNK